MYFILVVSRLRCTRQENEAMKAIFKNVYLSGVSQHEPEFAILKRIILYDKKLYHD